MPEHLIATMNVSPSPRKRLKTRVGETSSVEVESAIEVLEQSSHDQLSPNIERLRRLLMKIDQQTDQQSVLEVLANHSILSKILNFEGSFTFFHAHRPEIFGWQPIPTTSHRAFKLIEDEDLREPNHSRMRVCKDWYSLMSGEIALKFAEDEFRRNYEEERNAGAAAVESNLPLPVRLAGMAVTDDIAKLKFVYSEIHKHFYEDTPTKIGEIMSALAYDKEGPARVRRLIKPMEHPFKDLFISLSAQTRSDHCDSPHHNFDVSLSVIAAIYGSTRVLGFLKERFQANGQHIFKMTIGHQIMSTDWFQRRRSVIEELVIRICRQPLLGSQTKILDGIRELLDDVPQEAVMNSPVASGWLNQNAEQSGCQELIRILRTVSPQREYNDHVHHPVVN